MPTIYQLKPAFQNLLRPIVRRLAAAGVTANQVTLAAFVLSVATLASTASSLHLVLPTCSLLFPSRLVAWD